MEALSVCQLAAGVHGLRLAEREVKTILTQPFHRFAFLRGSVPVPPGAEYIKIFQSESWRIDLGVTNCARCNGPMLVQLLANGGGSARIGLHRGNTCRRRWRRVAQYSFHDPDPAKHRRRKIGRA